MKRIIFMLFLLILLLGCAKKSQVDLLGAGATFPQPLYEKMFTEYGKESGIKVGYHSIGSGVGIFRLKNKLADFGATDIIWDSQNQDDQIVYIPTCIGAVAIAYNLPANPVLNFTPDVLTDIFMGKIINWNDEKIKSLNPDVVLPNQRILVINRSDESGTSQIFNDYLTKVSNKWREKKKNSLKEFFALSANKNEEMCALISDTFGSIGFIGLSYAINHNMSYAKIRNSSGNFILPTVESVNLAAETEIPDNTKIYLTNTDAKFGYPISSFTWIIIHRDLSYLNEVKAKNIISLLEWMITDGQLYAAPLNYAPLPTQTILKTQKILNSITY